MQEHVDDKKNDMKQCNKMGKIFCKWMSVEEWQKTREGGKESKHQRA